MLQLLVSYLNGICGSAGQDNEVQLASVTSDQVPVHPGPGGDHTWHRVQPEELLISVEPVAEAWLGWYPSHHTAHR